MQKKINVNTMEFDNTYKYCFCGFNNPNQFMVQCDYCKHWYHGSCVNIKEYKVIEIDKYYCSRCSQTCGPSVLKPYTNWHRHDFWDPNANEKPVQTGTGVFIRELCSRHFSSEGEIITHMRGQQLTENYLLQNGFECPIVIDGRDGLDMSIPPENFSLYDIESYIGGDKEIDVIDVMRQTDFKMTLRDFVEYFNFPKRTRVFNVISLEFSNSSLSPLVEAPLVVRRLDWVNSVWPRDATDEDNFRKPQVQKYCLMSVKDSYTDFHIDFGGTSVWYHILKGEKIFYFIRPTPANLTLYQQWMTSSTQSETFFGDQVDKCYKCILRQGQTMLIPTGWIHAVYTSIDSLVFGGNFLHSLNIPTQLQIYDIEKKIKTVEKFKFPLFETINWYAAKRLMTLLKDLNTEERKCPNNFLTGIKALLAVLKQWNTEKDYNTSNREQIPVVINSHKLLKDLGKEIRHAERFLISLNPPKPERESKRKRKRPINKDFVDFSHVEKLCGQNVFPANYTDQSETEMTLSKKPNSLASNLNNSSNCKVTLNKDPMHFYERSQNLPANEYTNNVSSLTSDNICKNLTGCSVDLKEKWVVTKVHAADTQRAILKFTLGSKPEISHDSIHQFEVKNIKVNGKYSQHDSNISECVFDFHDDGDNRDDEFVLKIDETSTKKKKHVNTNTKTKSCESTKNSQSCVSGVESEIPKNGIESLLKASALTNRFVESARTSPSTQEAIAGMLSIGQTYHSSYESSFNGLSKNSHHSKLPLSKDLFEENISKVHQDDEYIYPSLDNSDEEDHQIFKPRGRSKMDEAWNPKARLGPLLPKMNRPAREGTKKQAVEKVLEAAAAKRASEVNVQETQQRRVYRKKKAKIPTPVKSFPFNSSRSSSNSHNIVSVSKQRKGMKTAKQRLGKILKIHRMIH